MTTAQDQPSRAEPATFEVWWAEEGQFCRAGGGDYEKTFAHRAWQAARALPAPVICYVRPGATLPRRMGWETCAATDAGALAVHADGRAAPTGVEPVAWTVAGGVTNWARDFSKYKTQHYVQPVFTAAQVLAMGRVPPGWQAVPLEMSMNQLLRVARCWPLDVPYLQRLYADLLSTASRPLTAGELAAALDHPPPAAQERKPLTDEQIAGWIPVGERLPDAKTFCDWLMPTSDLKNERWILAGEAIYTASVPGGATHWRPAQALPG